MFRNFILCGGIVVFSALPASAADFVLSTETPVAPVIYERDDFSWTGLYLGASGGYQWTTAEPETFRVREDNLNIDNGIAGGFLGYNYQFDNNLVLGLEGAFSYNWGEKSVVTDIMLSGSYREIVGKLDFGWGGSIRARAGYSFNRALIYATGGWEVASGELRESYDDAGFSSGVKAFSGWTVGFGAEYALTDKIFSRVEYRYVGFPEVSHPFNFDKNFSVKSNQSRVLVGLGYKF